MQSSLRTWLKNTWWLSSPCWCNQMTWCNWYDVGLCFSHWCGITGVLPGLKSSPWFLPLGNVYHYTLCTTSHHHIPLQATLIHTTVFNFTLFHTKYIYLRWHFIPLNTVDHFTPLHVITVTLHYIYIPVITFTLHYI